MRHILTVSLLLGAVLFTGCASPVESACSKAESCGDLGDKTYAQCVADTEKFSADIRDKNNTACDKIVSAFEAVLDCMAGLSCADFKKEPEQTSCKQVERDFEAAVLANNEACYK